MIKYIKFFISKCLNKAGRILINTSKKCIRKKTKLLKTGQTRSLYQTADGYKFWLNNSGYIDKQIINEGVFEPKTTNAIKHLIRPGDVVLDVGANIGYYTVIFSKLVGPSGKIFAFEPTKHFGDVLKQNIRANHLENIEIVNVGLSNKRQKLSIDIGPSSATLHSPAEFDVIIDHEEIPLLTLNDFVRLRQLEKIDFIKIDIDGHEPLFFEGAWEVLDKYSPVVIFEVSHLHYLQAGFTAWDFYDSVNAKGYRFFHEDDFSEITSRETFLRKCGNFAYSSNVIIAKYNINESMN